MGKVREVVPKGILSNFSRNFLEIGNKLEPSFEARMEYKLQDLPGVLWPRVTYPC